MKSLDTFLFADGQDSREIKVKKMLLAYDAYLKKCVELEIAKLKNDGHINDNIIS